MTDCNRTPRQKGSKKCWDEGKAARQAGTPRDECPYSPDLSPLRRAWGHGWDSLGPVPDVRVALPPTRTRPVEAQVRSGPPWFVSEAEARAAVYRKPQPIPCEKCLRLYLDSMSPACVLASGEQGGVVWLRCRACNHSFKRPVAP